MSSNLGKKIISWNTKFSADSAEFCPLEPLQDIFVIGTYQLQQNELKDAEVPGIQELLAGAVSAATFSDSGDEAAVVASPKSDIENEVTSVETSDVPSSKTRLGCLCMHSFDGENVVGLQTIDMAGILDMKWSCQRVRGLILLAVVTSVGELLVLELKEGDLKEPKLAMLCQYRIDDGSTLALSVDWSNRKLSSDNPLITVSDSKGKVHVFDIECDELLLKETVASHDFEAWITAFNYWDPNLMYTGGDDCKFKGYDLRCGLTAAVFTNKVHSAGVTSIHSNDQREHVLASGSYDERVYLWDSRHMRRCVQECVVGGGVWRLKWAPHTGDLLMAACMYNNFHVLQERGAAGGGLEVVCSYEEHDSIAYGVDWCWKQEKERTVASASFYDNYASLWRF